MRGGVSRGILALGMALGLVVGVEAWQEPEAFKGVRWGSPPEELQRVLAFPGCKWVGRKQEDGSVRATLEPEGSLELAPGIGESCYSAMGAAGKRITQIGDAGIWPPSFHYHANKMGMVLFIFNDHQYTKIREAFMAGYGSPTTRRVQQHQNAFGARFDSEELEWVGKKVTITLEQRTVHDLTKGLAVYQTPEFVRAEEAAKAAKVKRKPKGL